MKSSHEFKSKVCFPTTLISNENSDEGTNIFVGIGLWSKTDGLTAGLPIDVYSMIISADQLRKKVSPGTGFIYIYVADNLALESRQDHLEITEEDIKNRCEQIKTEIRKICDWLQINDVFIEDSSAFLSHESYQKILQEVQENKSSLSKDGNLDGTTENYVINQTALVAFYQHVKKCAWKVSWCLDEKNICHDSGQIQKNDNGYKNANGESRQFFDELWFDSFYKTLLVDKYPLQFIYTQPGINLNHGGHINKSSPYFAKDQKDSPRILIGDTSELLIGNETEPGKITRQKFNGPSKKKGSVNDDENTSIKFRYQLPPAFKKLMLALLQEIKENYGELVNIKSRLDESHIPTIIKDLATLANPGTEITLNDKLFCENRLNPQLSIFAQRKLQEKSPEKLATASNRIQPGKGCQ